MITISSKSELEIELEKVEGFRDPKIKYEQYRLPAPVVAEVLWYIGLRHRDFEGRIVADLGCGTGMFVVGSAMMGADYVVGVDIDPKALEAARRCAARFGAGSLVDFIHGNVEHLGLMADVAIQNPPFGVRVREADRAFLKAGIRVAPTLYSIHKGGEDVRRFVARFVGECGGKVDEILPLKIKLPPTYQFHKKRFHIFDVDLYRIVREH